MKFGTLSLGLVFEYLFLLVACILSLVLTAFLKLYGLFAFIIVYFTFLALFVLLPLFRAYISIGEKGIWFSSKKDKYYIAWKDIQLIEVTRKYKYRNGFKAICIYRKEYRSFKNYKISNRDYIVVGYKKKIINEIYKHWDENIANGTVKM